ncbi:hypothetical protein ACS0TY_007962 [Phlomoides rotata]
MEKSKKEHKKKRRFSSRLKKRAPSALHVDETKVDVDGFSNNTIPFLSPLVLSPVPLAAPETEANASVEGKIIGTSCGNEGWRHPAIEVAMDASKLGALLQAQCMLLNKT